MTARRIAIALAVIVGLGATGLVCSRVGERGRFALAYSTSGAGPDGARAAFLLAAEQGARPIRWAEDLGRIPPRATLVALGGCDHLASRPLSRIEGEHLVRWIEEGGTVIVAGAADYLPDALGIRMTAPSLDECLGESGLLGIIVRAAERAAADGGEDGPDGGAPDELAEVPDRLARDPLGAAEELAPEEGPPPLEWARGMSAPLEGIEVGLRRPARLSVDGPSTTLLTLGDQPAAVLVRRGEGRVIVIASASALQNRDLVEARGAVMLARLLAGSTTVIFDEYHLGAGARRSAMRYLVESGAGPVALQILAIVLLALWWRGARFGAPRAVAEAPPATTASFVSAIGTLFGRVSDPAGALAIVGRDAIARVARHHHQDAHDPERLAEALRARKRDAAADAVLAIARRIRVGAGTKIDLVQETRAIDAEVARAIGSETAGAETERKS